MICTSVTDQSQVAEARRVLATLAESHGFDEEARARVALVVTELATNLVKHARDGHLLAEADEYDAVPALNVLALDRGPGMPSVEHCLRDGFSTIGSPGTGMGAIMRQANAFDISSVTDVGSAIYVRLDSGRTPPSLAERSDPVGVVCLPKLHEEANGDAWAMSGSEGERTYLVVDGLGHGLAAAEAAQAAVSEFRRCGLLPIGEILEAIHRALRPTRGAAVAVARTREDRNQLEFAGIGNIGGAILTAGEVRKTVSRNGTAGHQVRRIQAYEYPFPAGSHFIMYSDGLVSSWSVDRYPGLLARHPLLIAGVLYRDFRRERDDVTVLVAARERS